MHQPSPSAVADWPEERTAVVTGAGSLRGIGRALAERLGSQGWAVALLDVDGAAATAAAEQVAQSTGARTLGVAVDVSDAASVRAAVTRVEAALPPVVAVANLAGVSCPAPFFETTADEWDRVMAVNARGVFLVTQGFARGMVERGLGRVVSASSVSAQRGGGTYSKSAYSASKAAIIGFTRAVAREISPSGVTVNAVAPGPVDTDIMGGPLDDERRAAMAADGLVGRVGTVADVTALMAFLVGPDSGYVTAAVYDINGGLQVS